VVGPVVFGRSDRQPKTLVFRADVAITTECLSSRASPSAIAASVLSLGGTGSGATLGAASNAGRKVRIRCIM
jgi:hypothetical protein